MKKPPRPKPKHRRGAHGPAQPSRAVASPGARQGAAQRQLTVAAAEWRQNDVAETITLLFLPFLVIACAILASQSLRPAARVGDLVATRIERGIALDPARAPASRPVAAPASEIVLPVRDFEVPRSSPDVPAPAVDVALPGLVFPAAPPALTLDEAFADALPALALAPHAPVIDTEIGREVRIATPPVLTPEADTVAVSMPSLVLAVAAPDLGPAPPHDVEPAQCRPASTTATPASEATAVAESLGPETSASFGLRLAQAAQRQTEDLVVYNDRYRPISYPGGDVAPLYGVCTDVVIRAYRALGIDLQRLVKEARVGSGDTSIDHRRTEVLRRFFSRHGRSLPVTDFAEDYQPGDIVTYHRPQNRRSRSHIAIVSGVIGPSGRPMILHNRGWGVQLEDALFVDEITGHYRYQGHDPAMQTANLTPGPAAPPPSAARPRRVAGR